MDVQNKYFFVLSNVCFNYNHSSYVGYCNYRHVASFLKGGLVFLVVVFQYNFNFTPKFLIFISISYILPKKGGGGQLHDNSIFYMYMLREKVGPLMLREHVYNYSEESICELKELIKSCVGLSFDFSKNRFYSRL